MKNKLENLSDEELFSLFRQGELKCFDVLLERFKRPLYSFIMGMINSREIADDIFQDVFYRLIKSADRYDSSQPLSSWLFKIANNCCIDYLRKSKKNSHSVIPAEAGIQSYVNPEEMAIKEETKSELTNAIQNLPPEQKQVLLMRIYGDFSFAEISKVLKCSQNTALSRMFYAVKNLKKAFGVKDEFTKTDNCNF